MKETEALAISVFDIHEYNKESIKENFEPVEDKPGYVWFSRRNFQIISIETFAKILDDTCERQLDHLGFLTEREDKNNGS